MKKQMIIFISILSFIQPLLVSADSAKSSIVMDMHSGRVLYSKNSNSRSLIASITKIMTCIVVLENSNLNDDVVVGKEVLKMYGTNIYVGVGEKLTVKDLLYGLMLRSGNDAAEVLAHYTFNDYEKFIKKMNQKAFELDMVNTVFYNPHGLDENTKNYSTASDMIKLAKYAYNNEEYMKIIGTKKYLTKSNEKSYIWYNRMKLLDFYDNCIGGKNGYTPSASKTLVSYARHNGLTLGIVTLGDNDIYNNHEFLYEKYFSLYDMYTIVSKDNFPNISNFGLDDVYVKNDFKYPLAKEEIANITTKIKINEETKRNCVGEVLIYLDDEEIGRLKVFKNNKKKKDDSIFQWFKNLFV